jgi:hypothetical protein
MAFTVVLFMITKGSAHNSTVCVGEWENRETDIYKNCIPSKGYNATVLMY